MLEMNSGDGLSTVKILIPQNYAPRNDSDGKFYVVHILQK